MSEAVSAPRDERGLTPEENTAEVREMRPPPPWSAEIGAMAGLLGWLEDALVAYVAIHGEAKARELLEAGLLEAENRRRGPLLAVRYLAELRPQ